MAKLQLASLVLLLLVLGGLVYFRPPLLGGDTSLIMVSGVSMQPTLWEGDLVVVKRAGSYAVGDVVAFRSTQGPNVIHRIAGVDSQGIFSFQGDNKPSVDPWYLPKEEIVGRSLLTVPRLGAVLSVVRNPLTMVAVLGFLFGSYYLGSAIASVPWGRRERAVLLRRTRRERISARRRGMLARLLSW